MTTMYNYRRDINSYAIGLALPFADDGYQVEVKASNGANIPVPSNFKNWVAKIIPNPTAEIWVSDAAITLPTDNTPDVSRAQIIPPGGLYLSVSAGDTIYLATANTDYVGVSVSLYAISN